MTPQNFQEKMTRHHNDVVYSFTISPDDKFQFTGKKGNARWQAVRRAVMEYLIPYMGDISSIHLYPDISNPTYLGGGKYPRIHWHGTIVFTDVIRYLTNVEPTGFVSEMDTIEDSKVWNKYCKKFVKVAPSYKMYTITHEDLMLMKEDTSRKNPPEKANIVSLCRQV